MEWKVATTMEQRLQTHLRQDDTSLLTEPDQLLVATTASPVLEEVKEVQNNNAFLNCPGLQDQYFLALVEENTSILQSQCNQYCGQTRDGVEVTMSGLLAMAHNVGPGCAQQWAAAWASKYDTRYWRNTTLSRCQWYRSRAALRCRYGRI